MTISHLLAEFAPERSAEDPILHMTEVEIEEERLTAFENGYSAGWEDAVKAQGEARVQAIAMFRQSLEDYAFTYHEARVQILAQLHPLFRILTDSVLPAIAQDTLGASIAAELSALAEDTAEFPVEIHVAPDFENELQSAVSEAETLPFVLIADSGLEPGADPDMRRRTGTRNRHGPAFGANSGGDNCLLPSQRAGADT